MKKQWNRRAKYVTGGHWLLVTWGLRSGKGTHLAPRLIGIVQHSSEDPRISVGLTRSAVLKPWRFAAEFPLNQDPFNEVETQLGPFIIERYMFGNLTVQARVLRPDSIANTAGNDTGTRIARGGPVESI